ncbi:MAG: polymer-forming cytoskeletal protein [Synergistaceae bacterium]|nr:polymer-forming cytoskeletal protein [Synergistaceae bacterium]
MSEILQNLKKAMDELTAGKVLTSDVDDKVEAEAEAINADEIIFEQPVIDIKEHVTNLPNIRQKSIITEGMDIVGDVHLTDEDLEVFGKIKGNIVCNGGTVYLFKSHTGNITAQCVFLSHCASVTGDLEARDAIQIEKGCVLKGHIKTLGPVSIKGKLVGNITTQGDVYIGADSVINGDVSSKSIEISKGAKINGAIKIE